MRHVLDSGGGGTLALFHGARLRGRLLHRHRVCARRPVLTVGWCSFEHWYGISRSHRLGCRQGGELMVRSLVRIAFAGVALVLIDTAFAQITSVTVTGGQVAGVVSEGIASYKGIPFAAPPVGDLRWKAPQPVPAWSGTRKADTYGPSCMQDPTFA